MKTSKFNESQIITALKENELGRSIGDISREIGIDKSTFITGLRSMEEWNSNNLSV